MAENLALDGMTASEVYRRIRETGVSESEAGILVGTWLQEYFGKVRRTFRYDEEFAASDESCAAEFARSFQHQDWVDGESVVQAEQTPGEVGFNERFHRIEHDLDSLGQDVSKAFLCISEMRASLHSLLDEIKTELNRINGDIYDCCYGGGGWHPVPLPTVPGYPPYGSVIDTGTFLGSATMGEKPVSLWRTSQGIVMLPTINEIGVDPTRGGRIANAGLLAEFIADHPEVERMFRGQGVTKQHIVDKFGTQDVGDGRTLAEVIDVLPEGQRYRSADALVNAVADREASIIRTTSGSDAAITAIFGLGSTVSNVGDAPVDRAEAIPKGMREALAKTDFKTIGALAKAKPDEVRTALKRQGVDVSVGDVSKWRGVAQTLARIR